MNSHWAGISKAAPTGGVSILFPFSAWQTRDEFTADHDHPFRRFLEISRGSE